MVITSSCLFDDPIVVVFKEALNSFLPRAQHTSGAVRGGKPAARRRIYRGSYISVPPAKQTIAW